MNMRVMRVDFDELKTSIAESSDGPMIALRVKTITSSITIGGFNITFHFKNGYRLAITPRHAFNILRGPWNFAVPATNVRPGDLVWVDANAFAMDGSLHKVSKGPSKRSGIQTKK